MVDEKNEKKEVASTTDTETDYIQAIKDLKENTVSKEKYAELKKQNKELLDSLVSGNVPESVKTPDSPKPDVDALRSKLYNDPQSLSNLDYVKTTLELRKALMDEGQPDPFLQNGKNSRPEQYDIDSAQRVADVLEECIEYADGNSEVFTNELMRRTADVTRNGVRRY